MLAYDLDLAREDIQLLASRDALAAFFARLGYNTNARLVQHTGALGIGADNLTSAITHIERLADEDSLFEIYLFELKSITNAVTQGLARAFRNRAGDYLLVLTDSYDRLDFVLVQRYTPDSAGPQDALFAAVPTTSRQVAVRPRVLTVNRRDPGKVALRVLRRFSYTEGDIFAQFDKLLSAYDVADWSEPYFNNRALFSDYYLKERLPEQSLWQDRHEAAAMTRAYRELRALYEDVRETYSNASAEVVRAQLIEPTLTILGFTPRSTQTNEIALSPTANTPNGKRPSYLPIAHCLAYTWNRSLDGKDEQRDNQTSDENPGATVVTLLDRGEAEWAIVTNGKTWRLYSAKAHSRATNYYEIDLEETLALPAATVEEAFHYFWLLFRAAAFVPSQQDTGDGQRALGFLDTLLTESERYARELGERLKERVFEEIFPHFARGFILHARQTGLLTAKLEDLPNDERNHLLEPYFSGTLTFLYRLLFLLYAESRDLLPMREVRGYYPHSLHTLKEEIASKAGPIVDLAPTHIRDAYNNLSASLYDRLQQLFTAIDTGDPALNVPVYNGGLFVTNPDPDDPSPEAAVARFLSAHKIPDRQLALGLDRMARDIDEKRHDLAFIDYKSLGVRQLGSIYEGLLEFKLRVAPEEMAVVKGKKTEEILPYAEAVQKKLPIVKAARGKDAPDKTYPRGHVYLENDRRERKATGSYYTPDYIVKYIVAHTVGPILQEKLDSLRPLFREAEQYLRSQRDKEKALQKQHLRTKGDDPENETYNHYRDTLNKAFFDLKVLDPAMGSGHFLVEAVDYITDQLAKFLTAFKWNPIVYELAKTRQEISSEMERQNVTVDLSKLTDINLLKRQVLKRCIYGVDLNPMAVELAKVSLWLDCFTLGAPLSFLDHHMKCGNSLIGGSVQQVQDALGGSLWGNQFTYLLAATELMRRVGDLSDVTAQEVAESRKAYQGAYDALAPFKRLLDVWTSEHFNNKGAQKTTQQYAAAIFDNHYAHANKVDRDAIATALELAYTKRFFHWELEFPEVFYAAEKRKDNGGFDAVVGNPPYVRQEGLSDDKTAFKAMYTVFNSIADLYTYFIERGNTILRRGGRFGMITANKFMRANYGAALRTFLTTRTKLETLIDFGELRVFGDAATDPVITLSSNASPATSVDYIQVKNLSFEQLDDVVKANAVELLETAFKGSNWALVTDLQQEIFNKLKVNSVALGEYVGGIIRRGILTGFNEAFVINQDTRNRLIRENQNNAEVIKPFLVGDDVRRYSFTFQDRYLIWTYVGIPINQYPAIYKHLQQYQTQLEKRWDKGNFWWELRHCDYYADFGKPKLLYPNIAKEAQFTYDDSGMFSNQKTYIIPLEDFYLLSILNSHPSFYWIMRNCSIFGDADEGGRAELSYVFMKNLPIRRITFTTPPDERARLQAQSQTLYATSITTGDQNSLLAFVDHHLSQQPEQSDIVHDLLAHLAAEMIRLNKEKQTLTKAFLRWLETTLRILPDKDGRKGIDALTGKSKLLDYPGDYQKGEPPLAIGELLDILQKNKSKLGARLSDSALTDQLRARYEESLARVLPLKDQLAKTDRLIDLVVYRLYGLTDEEIAVVEGR